MPEKIQTLMSSLGEAFVKLGARRLIALALIGVALFGTILFSSFYLARPTYETLYIGLSRDDVNRIGLALSEAGMRFDVSSDGGSVRVPVGSAERARMLLAEKGLPTSNNAGYELFDNMGSLGLTSFMQEITRQRALEGEIARTIQAVQGVKAARVHIVLPDKGSFRRTDQHPTASVVVRTGGNFADESAQSIRQLVAAAVPSLRASAVTIMDTSGHLLASGADMANGSSVLMASLEHRVSGEIEENIRRQLAPIVGINHFQTSVQVSLNTDRRQISETIYDPDSRVERSVRSVRDKADVTNAHSDNSVSVEQNIPQEQLGDGAAGASTDKHDRQEETANYEINTKTISTIRDGYSIDKLSVAVVVDRNQLRSSTGKLLSAQEIAARIDDIQKMVSTASGIDSKRGDKINVSAIDFINQDDGALEPIKTPFWQALGKYTPGLINGLSLLIAVILIIFLGVRPMMREMKGAKLLADEESEGRLQEQTKRLASGVSDLNEGDSTNNLDELRQRMRVPPQNRLEKMVELDEERFAGVLRDWVQENKRSNVRAI